MVEKTAQDAGARAYPRLALFTWFVLYFIARMLLERPGTPLVRVLISLAPVPAFIWFLRDLVRGMRGLDELELRIQLEALAVAFPLTMVLIMTLGLVQVAIPLSPDDWSYRHIWPFLFVFYLVGLTLARRRYQ